METVIEEATTHEISTTSRTTGGKTGPGRRGRGGGRKSGGRSAANKDPDFDPLSHLEGVGDGGNQNDVQFEVQTIPEGDQKKDKPFVCPICSRSFAKKEFLGYHIKLHK